MFCIDAGETLTAIAKELFLRGKTNCFQLEKRKKIKDFCLLFNKFVQRLRCFGIYSYHTRSVSIM